MWVENIWAQLCGLKKLWAEKVTKYITFLMFGLDGCWPTKYTGCKIDFVLEISINFISTNGLGI